MSPVLSVLRFAYWVAMVARIKAGFTVGLVLVVALVITAAPPASAAVKEQVVFSGEAEGSLGEVGFWVWCPLDKAGAYDDCNGAMRRWRGH